MKLRACRSFERKPHASMPDDENAVNDRPRICSYIRIIGDRKSHFNRTATPPLRYFIQLMTQAGVSQVNHTSQINSIPVCYHL